MRQSGLQPMESWRRSVLQTVWAEFRAVKPIRLNMPTRAIMAVLAEAGYIVSVGQAGDGQVVASARGGNGDSWQVRAPTAYLAIAELAEQVGFDLTDG